MFIALTLIAVSSSITFEKGLLQAIGLRQALPALVDKEWEQVGRSKGGHFIAYVQFEAELEGSPWPALAFQVHDPETSAQVYPVTPGDWFPVPARWARSSDLNGLLPIYRIISMDPAVGGSALGNILDTDKRYVLSIGVMAENAEMNEASLLDQRDVPPYRELREFDNPLGVIDDPEGEEVYVTPVLNQSLYPGWRDIRITVKDHAGNTVYTPAGEEVRVLPTWPNQSWLGDDGNWHHQITAKKALGDLEGRSDIHQITLHAVHLLDGEPFELTGQATPEGAIEASIQTAAQVADRLGNLFTGTPNAFTYDHPSVQRGWEAVWVVTFFVFLAVGLWAGFTAIFQQHIDPNSASWREIVPRLIISLIGATTSFTWCSLILDVANSVSAFIAASMDVTMGDLVRVSLSPLINLIRSGAMFHILVVVILYAAYVLFALILLAQMVIRLATINLLVMLAPAALGLWALPQTSGWAKLWLRLFMTTTFQQAIQLLAIGGAIGVLNHYAPLGSNNGIIFDTERTLFNLGMSLAFIYMATRVPSLLSNTHVYDAWLPMVYFGMNVARMAVSGGVATAGTIVGGMTGTGLNPAGGLPGLGRGPGRLPLGIGGGGGVRQ